MEVIYMGKKSIGERKRDSNNLKIILSVIVMAITFLAEIYIMIILKGNPIYLAIFGLVFLLFSYILVNSIIQNQYLQAKLEKEDHEGLLKSEKASYLIVKKSFEEIFQRLDSLEREMQVPTEELITAQKAIAKVNINRSKENTDALMSSNDHLIEKVKEFQEVLNNNNQKLLESQNQSMEQKLQAVILKQQELSSTIKEVQLNLKNEILQAVNVFATSQPQTMTYDSNIMPKLDSLAEEESITEELPMMEEPVLEEPLLIEEPLMLEEPVIEEEPLVMENSVGEEELLMEELPMMEESILEEVPEIEKEPITEEPPVTEEAVAGEPIVKELEEDILIPDMSDDGKMSPDDIAALIANL